MANHAKLKEGGSFIGIIADQDTVTGFMLAGIGDNNKQTGPTYLVVDSKTSQQKIIDTFQRLTERNDIAMILISQVIAEEIRFLLDEYDQLLPTILEIPSPANPYESEKDSVMIRVNRMLGLN
eukprot:TRINITY_DN4378_c0_g1_i1.p1 TRINITY_DN4378_c0_g1~~TRINITY_DN4378_c0_g1_i1.p1  ORF type:complete len:123 (+),score=29.09 TRINITY_DN4378_c0_g1_i1:36-404(+)